MAFKSVWGFDPDGVMKAQCFVARKLDAFGSACEPDEEGAARIPPAIN